MNNQLEATKTKQNKWVANLVVDALFLIAFLVVIEEKGTGPVIHEWLGVGIVGIILIHVLMHWNWVVGVTKRFFARLKAEPRINYLVDLGIFIGFTTIIFSGLMISESVLPALGLQAARSNIWKFIHFQATDVTILLTGLHLALHYKWILSALKRSIVLPLTGIFNKKKALLPVRSETVTAK
jgi:hypothetical protein